MARMLGEGFIPESVQQRRRRVREKVDDIRSPIRSKRRDLVPGPDIIGKVENKATGLRDTVVTSDGLMARIKNRRSSSGDSSSDSESNSSDNSRQFQNITT